VETNAADVDTVHHDAALLKHRKTFSTSFCLLFSCCILLHNVRQLGSCSRLTLQLFAKIVPGSCQASAKVAAIKEVFFAIARAWSKSAYGKNHQ